MYTETINSVQKFSQSLTTSVAHITKKTAWGEVGRKEGALSTQCEMDSIYLNNTFISPYNKIHLLEAMQFETY